MIILSLSKIFVYEEQFFNSVVIPDPCDQSPCGNNGTCEDVSGNATCFVHQSLQDQHVKLKYLRVLVVVDCSDSLSRDCRVCA